MKDSIESNCSVDEIINNMKHMSNQKEEKKKIVIHVSNNQMKFNTKFRPTKLSKRPGKKKRASRIDDLINDSPETKLGNMEDQ